MTEAQPATRVDGSGVIYLVAHGEVEELPGLPSAWWPLSEAGRTTAITLAGAPFWRQIAEIYCSGELGAFETAHLIAPRVGANVTAIESLWCAPPGSVDAGKSLAGDRRRAAAVRVDAIIAAVRAWTAGPIAVVLHPRLFALYRRFGLPVADPPRSAEPLVLRLNTIAVPDAHRELPPSSS